MKLKKIFINYLNFFLSNKYLEAIIRFLEPWIFNEKFEILIEFYRLTKG